MAAGIVSSLSAICRRDDSAATRIAYPIVPIAIAPVHSNAPVCVSIKKVAIADTIDATRCKVFVAAYPTVLGKPELMSVGMGVLLLVQSLGQFLGTFISSALLGPLLDQWVLCGTVACVLALVGTLCVAVCKFR